jgi:ribosomal protein L24E
MSSNVNFATTVLRCETRFVLVNGVPRTNQHCAFCGAIVEKGYVRESLTRFIYCDTQCFAEGYAWGHLSPKIAEGKYHEMRKSRVQSRYWTRPLSAGVVQQAPLLFKELP